MGKPLFKGSFSFVNENLLKNDESCQTYNRVVRPKIHLRKGFISISANDGKPKTVMTHYIILATRRRNLRRVARVIPFPRSCQRGPEDRARCSRLDWTVRGSLDLFCSKQVSGLPSQEVERSLNKCKETGIKLFSCLVITSDVWGFFDKEIKNLLHFMV